MYKAEVVAYKAELKLMAVEDSVMREVMEIEKLERDEIADLAAQMNAVEVATRLYLTGEDVMKEYELRANIAVLYE